jgi:AcrR family transcriptional regulator
VTRPLSKKETILEVAGDAFARLGYDRTTLEEIARECGITKPAIYYHFRDKASLYEAILCRRFDDLHARIREETDPAEPREALIAYIRIFGGFLMENPVFSSIFARELLGMSPL